MVAGGGGVYCNRLYASYMLIMKISKEVKGLEFKAFS